MVFGTLLIVYLLTFNGQFTSIDELNLYSMAESLVQTGTPTVPQIEFAAYHNPVGEHEIGFPLAATPLYWIAVRTRTINNIYTVMLLNPLLVAMTSGFVFLCAKRLNYSSIGSTVAAFAYGLGSLGWPYALSFYREPLVGFLWVAGIYGVLSWRITGRNWMGGLGILSVILSVLVKINVLFSIPFLFLITQKDDLTWKRRTFLIWAVAVAAVLVTFPFLYRWRTGGEWAYSRVFANINLSRILLRIYGQLFSPIKGLIFYMPSTALVAPALYQLKKDHLSIALGITLTFLSLLVATSFYATWYGGQSWGPRLLVPILPVLSIPFASLWDASQKPINRGFILAPLFISVITQAAVATNDWWKGYAPFLKLDPTPEKSAGLLFRHIGLAPPWLLLEKWRADELTPLWLQTKGSGIGHHQLAIGVTLFICLLGIIAIWRLRRPGNCVLLELLPVLLATVTLQIVGGNIAAGYSGLSKETAQDIAQWVRPAREAPYTIVTVSNEFHIYFFEGFLKGDFVHHWYSPHQLNNLEPILENTKGQQLSLLVDRVHIEPAYSGKELERWLNEQLYRFDSQWIGDYELARYAILSADNWTWQPIQSDFGPFRFNKFAVNTTQLSTHDVLGIQLQVCRLDKVPENYKIFVHLLGKNQVLEGLDGRLGYNGISIDGWQEGECTIEKRGIYVPPNAETGMYDLILGVYTPSGGITGTNIVGDPVKYETLTKIHILSSDCD